MGTFSYILVATPLDICQGRDRKVLYEKARAGIERRARSAHQLQRLDIVERRPFS